MKLYPMKSYIARLFSLINGSLASKVETINDLLVAEPPAILNSPAAFPYVTMQPATVIPGSIVV